MRNFLIDLNAMVEIAGFQILNRGREKSIAVAATEYNQQRDLLITDENALGTTKQVGLLAHISPDHVSTTAPTLSAIQAGRMGKSGATESFLNAAWWNFARSSIGRLCTPALVQRSNDIFCGLGSQVRRAPDGLTAGRTFDRRLRQVI